GPSEAIPKIEKMSSSRHRKPAKSSRVPPQAREYITELAEDRDLERFMAFSSTASSGASGSTNSCALAAILPPGITCPPKESGSRPGSGHRRRIRSSECPAGQEDAEGQLLKLPPSPPLNIPISQEAKPQKTLKIQSKPDEYTIIPIILADSQSLRPVAATQTMSLSVEDLRTPTKPPKEMHTKKTQTPESAIKSHKRLEWDPAADVGYYKRAVSTSNISTLERSVLEECGWRQPIQQRSETDLDRLQRQEAEAEEPSPLKDKPTQPLASSTFVNRSARGKCSTSGLGSLASSLGSRKDDTPEVSGSGLKQGDSCASSQQKHSRCSSRRESAHSNSQNETSRGSSIKESAEISSPKEDKSRKEETKEASLNNRNKEEDSTKEKDLRISCRVQDSQVSSLRASMSGSRRESLGSYKRDDSRLNSQNSSRMGSRMSSRLGDSRSSSRRESQGSSLYGSSAASSFDYHTHMDEQEKQLAKQEQQKRKQQVQEEREDHQQKEQTETENQQLDEVGKKRDEYMKQRRMQLEEELRKAEQREKEREQERQYTAAQFEKVLSSRRRENKENQQPPKPPKPTKPANPSSNAAASTSTSSSAGMESAGGPRGELDLGIDLLCSLVKTRSLSQGQKKKLVKDIARRISCLDLAESSSSLRSLKSNHSSNSKEQGKGATPPLQRQDVATNTTQTAPPNSPKSKPSASTLPVPAPRKRRTTGTTPSPVVPPSFSTSGSTSASHEVITQKTNVPTREAASTDADAEPSDLQEWLNPMTQSEIEYEQRLRGGLDSERRHQLGWIETEIRRLQALQKLLGDAMTMLPLPRCNNTVQIETDKGSSCPGDKLISAVPSVQLPSSSERGSGGQEEGKEIQGTARTSRTPQPPVRIESVRVPPKELPPVPTTSMSTSESPPTPPPPPPPPHLHQQKPQQNRKKMDTPVLVVSHSSSSGGGARSESVCSFVQQRQRQFREHYQNQQQQKLLLLQQQQLIQQQNLYHQQQLQEQGIYHHHRQHCPQHQRPKQHEEQQQEQEEEEQYLQMQYAQATRSAYATPPHLSASAGYSCADNERAIYYQVVNSQDATSYVQAAMVATSLPNERIEQAKNATSAMGRSTTTTTSSSSSSMLCISSEISIPMGMVNTCETTTTTTTHQYDDVACQRVRRVPRKAASSILHPVEMQRQTLQVRPQAIAYVIQFTATGGSEVLPETRSLQDQLQLARPEFCAKSKERKAILNEMQMIRNVRRQELDQLLGESTSLETLDRRLLQLPPPATSRLRIFTTREMKALTTKRCQSLPEVLAAQSRREEERRRRCNRKMRDVFNKRLQSRVANGQLAKSQQDNHLAKIEM
ncbi:LOW QUALITY PROTEIN: Alstrom syndrome protein 1 homolog a, partial [Drosophila ficusphila]|uniref:LOW QUALITY PROTEIN: Alstrom syndrome protein 1 homolog a n=1 Tax=Drosophila ficusphila TaxID=30025 RepID=UPI0007E840D9